MPKGDNLDCFSTGSPDTRPAIALFLCCACSPIPLPVSARLPPRGGREKLPFLLAALPAEALRRLMTQATMKSRFFAELHRSISLLASNLDDLPPLFSYLPNTWSSFPVPSTGHTLVFVFSFVFFRSIPRYMHPLPRGKRRHPSSEETESRSSPRYPRSDSILNDATTVDTRVERFIRYKIL